MVGGLHAPVEAHTVSSAFDQLERDRTPGRYTAWGRLGAGTGRLRAASTSGHIVLLRRGREVSL